MECETAPPPLVRLTLNSPAPTWYLPSLRVSAGKSGVGGGEWEVSSTQNVVQFVPKSLINMARASGTSKFLHVVEALIINPETLGTP